MKHNKDGGEPIIEVIIVMMTEQVGGIILEV
jgi:hypothetical protein